MKAGIASVQNGNSETGSTATSTFVQIEVVQSASVIPISIDGQKIPVSFDLGGSDTLELSTAALQKIAVIPLSDKAAWLDAKGNRLEARRFRVPELRIGSFVFKNVEGHEDVEAANWPKGRAGSGRLGADLLKGHTIVLNYPEKRLGLLTATGSSTLAAGCGETRIPFHPDWNGEAVSSATTDYGELVLVWDTGAPVTLVQPKVLGGDAKLGDRKVSARFAFNGEDFGPVELRGFAFSQPEGADGFLGHDFFSRFVVCVDFRDKSFRVARPSSPVSKP